MKTAYFPAASSRLIRRRRRFRQEHIGYYVSVKPKRKEDYWVKFPLFGHSGEQRPSLLVLVAAPAFKAHNLVFATSNKLPFPIPTSTIQFMQRPHHLRILRSYLNITLCYHEEHWTNRSTRQHSQQEQIHQDSSPSIMLLFSATHRL